MTTAKPKKLKWLRARSDEYLLGLVQRAAEASGMGASDFIRSTVQQRARAVLAEMDRNPALYVVR